MRHDRDIENMCLTGSGRKDAVADHFPILLHHPAGVVHTQTVVKDAGSPTVAIDLILDNHDLIDIAVEHRSHGRFGILTHHAHGRASA